MEFILKSIKWFVRLMAIYCSYMLLSGTSREDVVLMSLEGLVIFIWAEMEYKQWKENR